MKDPEQHKEANQAPIAQEDEFGIDIDLLQSNLELSYEDRLLQHHAAYQLLIELENARNESNSKSK